MFPGLETLPDDVLIDNPLYLLIEKDFGRPTIANQELFSIGWPDAEAQKLLAVPQHRPLLQIEMLSLTYQNQPYEHRISFCMTGAERIMRTL
jgi:DNA-binding GntR family transcriptional regulator